MEQGGWEGERGFGGISERVIAACIEVHRALGPGLLESTYESCLAHELELREIAFERQLPVPLEYKGVHLPCSYRLDLLVEATLIVEVKAVESILPIHVAQVLTYLRLTRLRTALLVNFHEVRLKHGLRRITLKPSHPPTLPVPGINGRRGGDAGDDLG